MPCYYYLVTTLLLPCYYLATPEYYFANPVTIPCLCLGALLLTSYSRYYLPPVYLKKAGEQRVSLGYCSGDSVTRDTDTFCGRTG